MITSLDDDGALLFHRIANLGIADTGFLHEFLEVLLVFVTNFNHDTGILGEKRLHDIRLHALRGIGGEQIVQVDVQTTLRVGKAHLQQRRYQTTGRDVVTSHHPSFLDKFLYRHEGIGKIFGILHRRHITAHLAQTLCKGGTAQPLLVEREVDMVQ